MDFLVSDTLVVELNHSNWNLLMKLIKFIAISAIIASTSLVSGDNEASIGVTQDVAIICPVWPYCRDVEIAEQIIDANEFMNIQAIRKAV